MKISDDELSFITGIEDEDTAIASLFTGHVQVVVYTKGANGATLFTKDSSFSDTGIALMLLIQLVLVMHLLGRYCIIFLKIMRGCKSYRLFVSRML
nr:hypothetical protein [Viridibacillus soli]